MKPQETVANATDHEVAKVIADALASGKTPEAALEELRTGSNGRFQSYAQMFDAAANATDPATLAMVQDADRAYFDVASNPAEEGFRNQLATAIANLRARMEREQAEQAQQPAGQQREVVGTGQYTEEASKGRHQGSLNLAG